MIHKIFDFSPAPRLPWLNPFSTITMISATNDVQKGTAKVDAATKRLPSHSISSGGTLSNNKATTRLPHIEPSARQVKIDAI